MFSLFLAGIGDRIMKQTKDNVHENHRSRMRGRFVASPDSLSKHELLELLLFYAVPRVNVNPLAHRLLNKYGSLSAVLRAPVEDLKKEEGIGENTAVYLSAIGRLLDVCADEQIVSQKLYSFSAVKDHVLRYYRFYTDEVFTLFLLDAKNRIIGKELFTQNDASAVELPFADFVRSLSSKKVKSIVVAHNHPNGICKPSSADDSSTAKMMFLCKLAGIALYDHIIVTDDDVFSYHYSGRLEDISSRVGGN